MVLHVFHCAPLFSTRHSSLHKFDNVRTNQNQAIILNSTRNIHVLYGFSTILTQKNPIKMEKCKHPKNTWYPSCLFRNLFQILTIYWSISNTSLCSTKNVLIFHTCKFILKLLSTFLTSQSGGFGPVPDQEACRGQCLSPLQHQGQHVWGPVPQLLPVGVLWWQRYENV